MKRALWFGALLLIRDAGATPAPEQANKHAGLPIFSDNTTLWDEQADAVAQRLGLPVESRTTSDASYRLYPPDAARVFGRRPYSIAMSAQNGKPVALNFVFANKGDSVGLFERGRPGERTPRPSKLLRDYRRAIGDDDRALDSALEELFGPAEPERTGPAGQLQEKSRRRDWNGHAFLLVTARDEYVALRIVPPADLDDSSRPERIPAKELKARLAAQVDRRINGDVVIRDIPMVDQGPKGFCVPATMERMLRHLGISADMYLLAMAANTDPGGGTTVPDVVAAVNRTAQRHGRRVQTLAGSPKTGDIAEWIEAGIPLLWAIDTSTAIDDLINARAKERLQVTDWAAWKDSLKSARRDARKLARAADGGHVCLVTGFNKETGEIAFSDSWGPEYAERWLTQEEAAAISQGTMVAVSW